MIRQAAVSPESVMLNCAEQCRLERGRQGQLVTTCNSFTFQSGRFSQVSKHFSVVLPRSVQIFNNG